MGKAPKTKTLDAVMTDKGISDAALGEKSELARGQIWAYRTYRKTPKVPAALAVLKALKDHFGVSMTIEELVAPPPEKGSGGRSKAA